MRIGGDKPVTFEYKSRMDAAPLKQTALIATLRSCQLFAGLPLQDLQNIAGLVLPHSLAKGEYLFHQAGPSHGFYIVQSGSISIQRLSPMGKEQVIKIFRAGDSFAEATLATDTGYPADAKALEPSKVLLVEKRQFTALVRQQPELALRMLASMSQHLRVLMGLLDDLTMKDVETRLANWLLNQCKPFSGNTSQTIELGMTKRVLASELGTVSETLSRTFAKLRDQKLIAVSGKKLTVLSPAGLRALIQKNLGETPALEDKARCA